MASKKEQEAERKREEREREREREAWEREERYREERRREERGKSYKIKLGLILFGMVLALFLIRFLSKSGDKIPDKVNDAIEQVVIGEEGKVHTISKADIERVFEISELSTADYTYNAIARAYTEDGTDIRYYVAYEGRIKAGIDFSEVEIEVEEENKCITITLPEVELKEKTVDPGTLEYIFKDKRSETETVHQEAFRLCEQDLEERAGKEQELLKLARENAIAVVEALVTPWVEQIDQEYQIEIR